ncbi:MAG: hypothetical protein MHM6MM_001095 [Cercozoa sp. M6MM]
MHWPSALLALCWSLALCFVHVEALHVTIHGEHGSSYSIPHRIATFGWNSGFDLHGLQVYPPSLNEASFGCSDFEVGETNVESKEKRALIIRRGHCEFAKKAKIARELGFHALIVLDNDSNKTTPVTMALGDPVHDALMLPSISVVLPDYLQFWGTHLTVDVSDDDSQLPLGIVAEIETECADFVEHMSNLRESSNATNSTNAKNAANTRIVVNLTLDTKGLNRANNIFTDALSRIFAARRHQWQQLFPGSAVLWTQVFVVDEIKQKNSAYVEYTIDRRFAVNVLRVWQQRRIRGVWTDVSTPTEVPLTSLLRVDTTHFVSAFEGLLPALHSSALLDNTDDATGYNSSESFAREMFYLATDPEESTFAESAVVSFIRLATRMLKPTEWLFLHLPCPPTAESAGMCVDESTLGIIFIVGFALFHFARLFLGL